MKTGVIKKGEKPACLQAFLYAMLIAAIVFLPFVIMDKGLFFYYGDFNVQQIPFYRLVHDAVRSGEWYWNWETDLGVNFIGSYSFYNLFSPFFWLTLPFPSAAVPYLIAPLLVLKTATAALTSCLYISRFTRDSRFAILGGLLYAFSGWAVYNIFFNHFHEVLAFFPLILFALERLVVDGKRGWFALAVALNCMVNYWFFIGSALFTILYVLVRILSGGWAMTVRKFMAVALESLLGVGLSCFALLPSVLAILGNPRTTGDNILTGWGFWLYGHEQRQPAILESIFFPPDIPSRPNFFPDHGAKWASLSAWLPMIGPSFVLAYLLSTPRSWVKRMLYLCLCMAMVPGLNAFFILFNNSYYARWFYMPVLLMALASALALERYVSSPSSVCLMRGLKWTAVIDLIFVLAIGLTPHKKDDKLVIGLEEYPERFWIYAFIVLLGLIATWLLLRRFIGQPDFFRLFTLSLGCICAAYSIVLIAMGRMHSNDREWMRTIALPGRELLELPEEEGRFDRSDLYDSMDNLGMYWGLPNIQAFHSIVPVSLMEFYPSVGVKRDVSSKPQPEFYPLRSLLSVRWLFVAEDAPEEKQPSTSYFTYADNQLGFNIYENENYLPMGFGYDRYITREDWEKETDENKQRLLLRAVLVEEEDIRNVGRIIDPLPQELLSDHSQTRFLSDVEDRSKSVSGQFFRDRKGFSSELYLDSEQIVFYSIPYDKGWSAEINGTPTRVLKVNGGFLGIPVPAGYHVIRFNYVAPGLRAGICLTLFACALLLCYLLVGKRFPLPAARRRLYPDLPEGAGPLSSASPSLLDARLSPLPEGPPPFEDTQPGPEEPAADEQNPDIPELTLGAEIKPFSWNAPQAGESPSEKQPAQKENGPKEGTGQPPASSQTEEP
ncbi:MAG: YfhO family protein [Provencibacterium sp.]|nr:YfhO family protein [Provencibacterium sp.]